MDFNFDKITYLKFFVHTPAKPLLWNAVCVQNNVLNASIFQTPKILSKSDICKILEISLPKFPIFRRSNIFIRLKINISRIHLYGFLYLYVQQNVNIVI